MFFSLFFESVKTRLRNVLVGAGVLGFVAQSVALATVPDAEKLSAIPAAMSKYVDWGELAGAVTLVAHDGKIVAFDAVGSANLAEKRPMEKDTLFWVASMTKPITAAAALLLVEERKLSLSDPVEKYIPDFKDPWVIAERSDSRLVLTRPARPVLVRDLFLHTDGLDDPPRPLKGTPLAALVASIARAPLQFDPGTQWKYNNAGLNTLGRVVEIVSGEPFEEFLQKRFFNPLGMKDTTFFPDTEQLKRRAKPYVLSAKALVESEIPIASYCDGWARKDTTPQPAGGLFSTAEDMFRFYQMLLSGGVFEGRRYLSEGTVKKMLSPQTGDLEAGFNPGMAWGLGIGIVQSPQGWTKVLPPGAWGHDGAYGTSVMADPGRHLLFILMIQERGLNPYSDGPRFRYAFQKAVMDAFSK